MMYAHCDNFLKKATEYYVEYIKDRIPRNYKTDTMWLMFKGKEHVRYALHAEYVSPFRQEENFQTYFAAITSNTVLSERSFGYKALEIFCDYVLQIQFSYSDKRWRKFRKKTERHRAR